MTPTITILAAADWETIWSAVSAIATTVAVTFAVWAIYEARRQLRLNAWLKAQEIFTAKQFTEARSKIFSRLGNAKQSWTKEEEEEAKLVCRKMSELADLVPILNKKKTFDTWDDPVAKAWVVLESFVNEERTRSNWPIKWKAFEDLGKKALNRLVRKGRDPRRKTQIRNAPAA